MAKTQTLSWNLGDLYSGVDDPNIKTDLADADKAIVELKTYRDKIKNLSSGELLALIKKLENLSFVFHRLGLFSGLLESTNIWVDAVTRFSKNMDAELIKKGQEIIFIDVELAHLDDATWQKHLKAAELKPYGYFLLEQYRSAKHVLSEPEEKILAEKSQTSSQALAHLFTVTTNTLQIPWQGKVITLDELLTFFHDSDATVRKDAALAVHSALQTNDKTTPPIYNALIQDKGISDSLRHFDYPEQARLESDDIERDTVQSLIVAVNDAQDIIDDYYALKKKILGVKKLFWWDRYAPLPEIKTEVPIDQAKTMVIDAFAQFSPDVAAIAKKLIDQKHIDWLPSPTKRGGAFCAFGGQGVYPYVLLNYTNKLRDVMTLGHELGHAVHDVLAQENNVFFQTHPSLALAEIASTFAESVVFEKLLTGPIDKKDRVSLLMGHIEDSMATIHRQIMMFQFEQKMHTLRKTEGEMSKDAIDALWQETMVQAFGKELEYTPEHANTWMYISHIMTSPFYVYSYAFAQLCTLALFKNYKEKGSDFVPVYLDILRAGGSLSPKDTLARAGFDIGNTQFWQDGLQILRDYIAELKELA